MTLRRAPLQAALACFVACLALLAGAPGARAAEEVRVLLARDLPETVLDADGAHQGRSQRGGAFATALPLHWPLVLRDGELHSGGRPVGAWFELHADEGWVRWRGRRYRGRLRVEATAAGMRVLNVLDVEAYLRGVVPAEMKAEWPLEALKAQAVAARSYALASRDPSAPWDLCAERTCQVYRGAEAEHPRSDRAVAATSGVVVTWNGTLARTPYHADSGGTVAASAEVWGGAVPFLAGRRDVAYGSPHRGWTHRLDPAAVGEDLRARGHGVGAPRALRIEARGASGRVVAATVVGSAGEVRLRGSAWTEAARAWGLKSTRFSLSGPWTAHGDGWGHGVGLSQYGARALAARGYEWRRILAFYYPGTGLQRRVVAAP